MSSTNSYQKGAIAQCADSQSPNVRSTQWACVTKIRNNNTVEELYIFDDEQGAKDCKQWVADGCPSASAPSPTKILKPRGERTLIKIVQNVSDLQSSNGMSSQYVGKSATGVSMPIFTNGTFHGMQTVDVAFVDNAGKLHAEYMWQGQTVTTQIDR